jgi:hypothetical protein
LFIRIKYITCTIFFFICIIFLFAGGKSLGNARSIAYAWNLGHIVLYTLSGFLLTKTIKQTKNLIFIKQIILFSVLTIISGLIIEIIQLYTGREFSLKDVLWDFFGILIFLAFFSTTAKNIKKMYLRIFQFSVLIILSVIIIPLGIFIIDEVAAKQQFPVLSNFETWFEDKRWRSTNKLKICDNPIIPNNKSLKATLSPGRYSGLALNHFPQKWAEYKILKISVFNSSEKKIKIYCGIRDKIHDNSGYNYNDRYNGKFILNHGWNQIKIDLNKVLKAPLKRDMDMNKITSLSLFMAHLKNPMIIYIDDVKLKK